MKLISINRRFLIQALGLLLLLSNNLNAMHSPALPVEASDRIKINDDNSRVAIYKTQFPLWGAAAITAACTLPFALLLYDKLSPLKELMVLSGEGIKVYGKMYSWKEIFSVKETTQTIEYNVLRFIEIRTEEDERVTIGEAYLPVGIPKFLKAVDYYQSAYQIKAGKNVKQSDLPQIELTKFVDIAPNNDSITFYQAKTQSWVVGLAGLLPLISIPFWYIYKAEQVDGAREYLIFTKDGLTDAHSKTTVRWDELYQDINKNFKITAIGSNLLARLSVNGKTISVDMSRVPVEAGKFGALMDAFKAQSQPQP